jgi:hypothetical protein
MREISSKITRFSQADKLLFIEKVLQLVVQDVEEIEGQHIPMLTYELDKLCLPAFVKFCQAKLPQMFTGVTDEKQKELVSKSFGFDYPSVYSVFVDGWKSGYALSNDTEQAYKKADLYGEEILAVLNMLGDEYYEDSE